MSIIDLYWNKEKKIDTILSFLIGIVLWEVIDRAFIRNALIIVPPSEIATKFINMVFKGELLRHIWFTFVEFILGYIIGVVLGLIFGIVIGISRKAKEIIDPWVTILYNVPIVALAPLFIIAFGIGLLSKIAIVFVGAVFPVLFNTYTGIVTVEQKLVEAIKAFGGSKRQVFFKVTIPSAIPLIMTGLRLSVGRAVVGAIVSELFGAKAGIGHLIYVSGQEFDTQTAFVGVTLLGISGYLIFEILKTMERKIAPWYSYKI